MSGPVPQVLFAWGRRVRRTLYRELGAPRSRHWLEGGWNLYSEASNWFQSSASLLASSNSLLSFFSFSLTLRCWLVWWWPRMG